MPAVHHIAFNCVDRLAQERFYTQHFGFQRARVFNPGQPSEFVMLRCGDTLLELFTTGGSGSDTDMRGGEQPVGFKHLCFSVEDIGAKKQELEAAGLSVGDLIDASAHAPGLTVCFFQDPEGNILELMQGWQDEDNPPPAP